MKSSSYRRDQNGVCTSTAPTLKGVPVWNCEALLLDMDGTIVDSNACVIRQWARWASRHGLDLTEVLHISHGRRTIETMRLLRPDLAQPAEADRFLADEAADLDDVTAIPGAVAFVQRLPPARWAVVTSSSEAVARARLLHTGFPAPPALVAAEHVTHGKPDPEPFLTAARLLGVEPARCLVVEDANSGIAAARAAGMQVLGAGWATRETLDAPLLSGFDGLSVDSGPDGIVLRG